MPTAADFFPSNYVRAGDLGGREAVVTIAAVESGTFENDGIKQVKPVIRFTGDSLKPLVCNKTNFMLIAAICGENTDSWPGKQICLYADMVGFRGQVTEAIRVKRPLAEALDDANPF